MSFNITCVIYNLGGGGAERVMTYLTEGLNERGHNVTLLTLEKDTPDFYSVPQGVKRIYASDDIWLKAGWSIFRRIKRRKALQKSILDTNPDIVISFLDIANIRVLYAMLGTGIPVLVAEHTNPAKNKIGPVWSFFRRLYYPFAGKVVMLTQKTADWARKKWFFSDIVVIPNPIVLPEEIEDSKYNIKFADKNIVSMGRLGPEKGFDILISAFKMISDRFPHWNLIIIGEGKERNKLEKLIDEKGLADRVYLPGRFNPPFALLNQGDIYVMSSRLEGFPMALCEAMACGLPVISFDCPTGPGEIIRNGIDGILVYPENEVALASAMIDLMSNDVKRKELATKAPSVLERFSLGKYLDRWESLIHDVLELK